jgi:hypothetical protein
MEPVFGSSSGRRVFMAGRAELKLVAVAAGQLPSFFAPFGASVQRVVDT